MKEQLYKDFTEKLLPKIGEGLQITKDYFIDLFGRYIKYLIITDSLAIGISVILMIVGITTLILLRKKIVEWNDDCNPVAIFIPIICGGIILGGIIGICVNTSNLIKDIYIPEVRVLQEIQNNGK